MKSMSDPAVFDTSYLLQHSRPCLVQLVQIVHSSALPDLSCLSARAILQCSIRDIHRIYNITAILKKGEKPKNKNLPQILA